MGVCCATVTTTFTKVFEIQNGLNESIQPRLATLQCNESLLYLYEVQIDNTTLSI